MVWLLFEYVYHIFIMFESGIFFVQCLCGCSYNLQRDIYWRSFLLVWDRSALAQVQLLFESSVFESGVLIDGTCGL